MHARPSLTITAGPRVAALILAAGRSTRMGKNKLLLPVDGIFMIRRVADAALNSAADPIIIVTGHDSEKIARLFINDQIINDQVTAGQINTDPAIVDADKTAINRAAGRITADRGPIIVHND
ncbi:MAG TPA: NTP transferase domain-containing protein, partial [Spongiibacteraceae bacterium]|nr:NTP transferase domain-containing protein [Spongiibacteraceae bacterium]